MWSRGRRSKRRSAVQHAVAEWGPAVDVLRYRDVAPAGHRKLLMAAAEQRGLEVVRVGNGFLGVHEGRAIVGFANMVPHTTSRIAERLCASKHRALRLLRAAGLPVPQGRDFTLDDPVAAEEFASELGWPVVVKPTSMHGGQGVIVGVDSSQAFLDAWEAVSTVVGTSSERRILVEKEHEGIDLRVYVVGSRAIAAVVRLPAYVRGDGRSEVAALVELKNTERLQHPYLRRSPIVIDEEVARLLARQGLTLDSVPGRGEFVLLRRSSNVSLGGENVDVTDTIASVIGDLAVNAVDAIPGLDIAGVDILLPNVSSVGGVVIEINTSANLTMHHFPVVGKPRDVADAVIGRLMDQRRGQ